MSRLQHHGVGTELVTSKDWKQRDRFLELVTRGLGEVPPRKAYYPGAFDRYAKLLAPNLNVFKDPRLISGMMDDIRRARAAPT